MRLLLALSLAASVAFNWLAIGAWYVEYESALRWQSLAREQDDVTTQQDEVVRKASAALSQCMELYIQAR
jgi:hypothetical protein